MILVEGRDIGGRTAFRRTFQVWLDAANHIGQVELISVKAGSDAELERFRAYCATLKPKPLTW